MVDGGSNSVLLLGATGWNSANVVNGGTSSELLGSGVPLVNQAQNARATANSDTIVVAGQLDPRHSALL